MAENPSRTKIPSHWIYLDGHIGKPIWMAKAISYAVGFLFTQMTKTIRKHVYVFLVLAFGIGVVLGYFGAESSAGVKLRYDMGRRIFEECIAYYTAKRSAEGRMLFPTDTIVCKRLGMPR